MFAMPTTMTRSTASIAWRSIAGRDARAARVRRTGREGRKGRWARVGVRAQDSDRQAEELEQKLAVGSRRKVRRYFDPQRRWRGDDGKETRTRPLTRNTSMRVGTHPSSWSMVVAGHLWRTSTCCATTHSASIAWSFASRRIEHGLRFEGRASEGVFVGRFQDTWRFVLVEPPHLCHHHDWLQRLGGVSVHRSIVGLVRPCGSFCTATVLNGSACTFDFGLDSRLHWVCFSQEIRGVRVR